MEWIAEITAPTPALSDEALGTLAGDVDGVITYHAGDLTVTATINIDAPTLRQATDQALRRASALPGRPSSLRIMTIDQYERQVAYPPPLELVGIAEAAEILRVSRQRVGELVRMHAGFPAPIAQLAAGPVFTRASVVAFDERWERKITGRPRKAAAL